MMGLNKEQVLFGGWGMILLIGFVATKVEFFSDWDRLWWLWFVLTLIGLGLMVLTMNLRERTMQLIFGLWMVVIGAGVAITYAMATGRIDTYAYTGAVWLAVMGVGHIGTRFLSGSGQFLWSGLAQLVVAAIMALLRHSPLGAGIVDWQFVITGLVSSGAMFYLLVPKPLLVRQRT
jgi:hypothetical protein